MIFRRLLRLAWGPFRFRGRRLVEGLMQDNTLFAGAIGPVHEHDGL